METNVRTRYNRAQQEMCGIAGFVNKDGRPADRDVLRCMTDRVQHRGPDGFGYHTAGSVGLGHRRLAILDLSETGTQPMHYADGRLTIIFNGEIYNYIELREELRRLGYEFVSASDTEVILAAYAEWGADCVQRFNGMWAFAIHDRQQRKLFCSRDRFGVKPFHYVNDERVFAFGSEIKQLLDFVPARAPNGKLLVNFLLLSLCHDTCETFIEGVHRLPPGHNLAVDLDTGAVTQWKYYQLRPAEVEGASPEQVEQRFLETLCDAIELRLRSDVRVGTCLSGGLDSAAIATLAARRYHQRTHETFRAVTAMSICPKRDESGYARQVAENAGLRWITHTASIGDFIGAMKRMAYHQEEPVPSASPLMQYLVMQLARESGIPVLLDGQGADETLLGYPYYFGMYLRSLCGEEGYAAAWHALRSAVARNTRLSTASALKYAIGLRLPRMRHLRARRRANYVRARAGVPSLLYEHVNASKDWRSFQIAEIEVATLPALLRFEDRNSMAFSVETRLPFLDYRLVELCVGMPIGYKIRDGWTKWVLRRAMAGTVPESIVWRTDKIGFEAPDDLIVQQQAEIICRTILQSDLLRSLVDEAKLRDGLARLPVDHQFRLFALATWAEQFEIGRCNAMQEEFIAQEEFVTATAETA